MHRMHHETTGDAEEQLKWADGLGTEHDDLSCDCVVCEERRDARDKAMEAMLNPDVNPHSLPADTRIQLALVVQDMAQWQVDLLFELLLAEGTRRLRLKRTEVKKN